MNHDMEAGVCVIGAGSGGLSVAAGIAQLGLDTVLIEENEMGGDCLNTGCVPSKALLAAARRAQLYRNDDIQGITPTEPIIDFAAVKDHVAATIAAIRPNDSRDRFEGLGVKVIHGAARFLDPERVRVNGQTIKSRYFVIATGSRPVIPPIPGLDQDKVLTNESIFKLKEKPEHLLIIGGGPIGVEMAQAHRRLGCEVSLLDQGPILPRDDRDNVEVLRQALQDEGVNLYEGASIDAVRHAASLTSLVVSGDTGSFTIEGTHLLVAAGRAPVTAGLDLEKAGVGIDEKGIRVDKRLRTTRKHIYAVGDVAGGPQFTHVAGYHAGIVIRNICFRLPASVDYRALPWVTYTDPEVAQVGLTHGQAVKAFGKTTRVVEWPYRENDRAIAERTTRGRLKVITTGRGRILGVSIVGQQAGELCQAWGLAIGRGLKIGALAGMIAPYPTLGELNKSAAGSWYTPLLFGDRTRKLVKLLYKLHI